MIHRPSVLAFAPILAALAFVGALGITPVLVSHDRPPGAAIRFWWARLAPASYAVDALRSASVVIIPVTPSFCPDPESQTRAWLTLLDRPEAERTFRRLFTDREAVTRFYALLGFVRTRSPALAQALARSQRDSAPVRVVRWPAPQFKDVTVPLASLASLEQTRWWAQLLADLGPPRCAA